MSPSLLDPKFIVSLVIVAIVRALCPNRYYPAFGALASAAILWFAAPVTLLTLVSITILLLFPIYLSNVSDRDQGQTKARGKFATSAGIIVLLLLLLSFKIFRQIEVPSAHTQWLHRQVVELVGFSYFIFRAIGFLHIQTILKFEGRSPFPLLYYALFPSTLTSGPIQKYQDFQKQIDAPEPLSAKLCAEATYRITRGYFRKLVLAVGLDAIVVYLLKSPTLNAWLVVVLIAVLYFYFYFDFSGYSDIAIGFGLLLGIRVPENFRQPFRATTVAEFWRNWHITLADWLREHVFIPLGGMRASRHRAAAIAFGIMVLCGLWHGLTWSFLAWGVWHGLILYVEALMGVKPVPPGRRSGFVYWARVIWTNGRVALGAVFFLPSDSIQRLLAGLTNWRF